MGNGKARRAPTPDYWWKRCGRIQNGAFSFNVIGPAAEFGVHVLRICVPTGAADS